MSAQLEHPILGKVIGNDIGKVVQYLGVQYATLANGFADARLPEYSDQKEIDATKYGPSAICPKNACDMEHVFIQQALPYKDLTYSVTDCLNLNISVPKTTRKDLPVFVFVHGGGFGIGSNAWPQYDLAAFVERSVDRGTPVVAVNINYRLGFFGFLTSQELRDSGISANRGLRDQTIAFRWIQKYIAGFGGDSENVTIAGESAGAIGCLLHAKTAGALFKRVFSMGGTPLLMKPLLPAVADHIYLSVLEKLGISASTSKERFEALLTTSTEDVLGKVPPSLPLLPIVDGDIVQAPASFATYGNNSTMQTCGPLLIGDCGFDSSILFFMLHDRLSNLVSQFRQSITKSLVDNPEVVARLFEGYGITEENSTENLIHVLEFGHDIGFYAPVREIAKSWPQQAFVYHFNVLNPWDGQWKGYPSHILDVAILFQNYNHVLPLEQQQIGAKFADDVLDFVSGKAPFPAFEAGKEGAQVYGPSAVGSCFVRGTTSEDYGRRHLVLELAEKVGFDNLSAAWDRFMVGPEELLV